MIHTIQTVSDYIEEIEKLINNKKYNYYFRGRTTPFPTPCRPSSAAASSSTTRTTCSTTS